MYKSAPGAAIVGVWKIFYYTDKTKALIFKISGVRDPRDTSIKKKPWTLLV